ncbi:amino acid ABC transporter substrate-binding protein [Halobacteriovorax sp. HLS]|uniref:amino acid ABC transporter substrate-binding protein n=1 Tax=Halobacteriovorax sp. HLS TaxID=2234000 RepID=UPI000FDB8596|nr:amino acid ABC transporter substrate-binding protein [Halobacteriovorax sp. HLS]
MKQIFGLILFFYSLISQAGNLAEIRERGFLLCGVSEGIIGFSSPDSTGNWSGIDVDVCKSVAISIFSDSKKVKYIPLNTSDRFKALRSGRIDILSRNTTLNLSRSITEKILFAPVVFFDGQGFLVKKSSGVKTVANLRNAKICVQKNTTSELNLIDYKRKTGIGFKLITFTSRDEVVNGFMKNRCRAMSADISALIAQRASLGGSKEYIVLKENISKEPLAPAVMEKNVELYHLLTWVIHGLIYAEEMGINSTNVSSMLKSSNPGVRRFLGAEIGNGAALKVGESWAYDIINELGNYGEVFERNLGKTSPVNLVRGLNELSINKGLHYSYPLR